jgi:hypothetical protein
MFIFGGKYTGNGTSQSVTGLPSKPVIVMVMSRSSGDRAVFKNASVSSTETNYFAHDFPSLTTAITSLDSTGFTVSSDGSVNTNLTVYDWIAFCGGNTTDIAEGIYTGSGVDNKTITGLGFKPTFVVIKQRNGASPGSSRGVWSATVLPATNSAPFHEAQLFTDAIKSLDTDGFTLGTDATVNGNTNTYTWIALKDVSGRKITQGTFLGDGVDPRAIIGAGFRPDMIWIKCNDNVNGHTLWRSSDISSDGAKPLGAFAGYITNTIETTDADGFTVGPTRVNINTFNVYWLAFKNINTGDGSKPHNNIRNVAVSGGLSRSEYAS